MSGNNRNTNTSVNTSVKTALYEARSGERARYSGVYGEYYLGEYLNLVHVFSVGDIFPDRQVGVTFCLHEAF